MSNSALLLAVAVVACSLGVHVATLRRFLRAIQWSIDTHSRDLAAALEGRDDERLEAIEAQLRDAIDLTDRLPQKWDEVTREARNFYQRATHHVRRARAELEEHGVESPELEELAAQLQLGDVEGGRAEGVPAVPTDMVAGSPHDFADPRDAEVEALIQSQWR